jgi:hypothetical protein
MGWWINQAHIVRKKESCVFKVHPLPLGSLEKLFKSINQSTKTLNQPC